MQGQQITPHCPTPMLLRGLPSTGYPFSSLFQILVLPFLVLNGELAILWRGNEKKKSQLQLTVRTLAER